MNAKVNAKSLVGATPVAADGTVSLFDFKGHNVRVVMIDAEPWFVARDLYLMLFGTTTGVSARTFLVADETRLLQGDDFSASVALNSLRPVRGRPRLALLSESGLYKLVMRSDKPEAKAFQDHVTKVILPSIRKDGGYILGEEKVAAGELSEDELVLRALEVMQRKIARLTDERDGALATITEHLLQVTVDEWRALSHTYLQHGQKTQLGVKASRLMKERGIDRKQQARTIRKAGESREVFVNVYPKHLLDEVAGAAGYLTN